MSDEPASKPVFIRTASKRDLPAIRDLLVETWHDTFDGILGRDVVDRCAQEWGSDATLTAKMNTPRSEFILADSGDSLSGIAYATSEGKIVTLHQLYVRPQAQGQGVGTGLMQELFYCFDDAEEIRLNVHPENIEAIGFYTSGGFVEIGEMNWSGPDGLTVPHKVLARKLDN